MPRSSKPKLGKKRKSRKRRGQRKKTRRKPPMMSPMCNALAYVLRELPKLRKLSLEELAEASGV